MIKPKHFTEDQLEQFILDYPNGDNKELAVKYKMKENSLITLASNLKVKKSPEYLKIMAKKKQAAMRHPLAYDEVLIEKFKKLYFDYTDIELCEIFDCHISVIRKNKKRHGLSRTLEQTHILLKKRREDLNYKNNSDTYERKLEFAKSLGFRNLGNCIAKLGLKEFEFKFKNR